jgi:hypothetical protein
VRLKDVELRWQPPPPPPKSSKEMTKQKHLAATFKQLERVESNLEALTQLALELGANPVGLHSDNAVKAVLAAGNELLAARAQAEGLGYKSLALALKALSQTKTADELPEVFRYYPEHWVREAGVERVTVWNNGKSSDRNYKVTSVTPLMAQRNLKRLAPVLADVIEEAKTRENPEGELAEVVESFNTDTYEEFAENCFRFLRGRTPVDAENEAKVAVEPNDSKLERCLLLTES